jgi:hypothetical protein
MRKLFPCSAEDIRRGWQSRTGDDEADITSLPYGLWAECKHHKQVGLRAALRQAEAGCPAGKLPVVFGKDDRKPAVVLMYMDDWELLVRRLRGDLLDL